MFDLYRHSLYTFCPRAVLTKWIKWKLTPSIQILSRLGECIHGTYIPIKCPMFMSGDWYTCSLLRAFVLRTLGMCWYMVVFFVRAKSKMSWVNIELSYVNETTLDFLNEDFAWSIWEMPLKYVDNVKNFHLFSLIMLSSSWDASRLYTHCSLCYPVYMNILCKHNILLWLFFIYPLSAPHFNIICISLREQINSQQLKAFYYM